MSVQDGGVSSSFTKEKLASPVKKICLLEHHMRYHNSNSIIRSLLQILL